jgi:peptide/nickel transport system permease protein
LSNISPQEIKKEFLKSKMGIAGITILTILISTSIIAIVAIPVETFQEWNNPSNWISNPKVAIPIWVNIFLTEKIPEHFGLKFDYDDFPNDFIYEFSSEYSGSPLLQMSVIRPDGIELNLLSTSLPYSDEKTIHSERIFSTDHAIKKNLDLQSENFQFRFERKSAEDIVFSKSQINEPLKGNYIFSVNLYGVNSENQISESKMIVGGKAFGIMGTDELRRDLAIGLLWGTPLALFIGLVVSIASVIAGLLYGVYAGYKGKKTDEAMMRFNDVIYALPALPFLIILSVTISNSIFVMVGFLMIFGWVGIAKVSRSMSLQIKTRGYVDAANMMGQKDSKIILKHIVPQLLPYAFASIAISVPAAITTEAGLSFLGLGDPTFPTWGQILHDANTFGAAARGMWWWIMPPGVMIAFTGLAFVFIGNALDAIINPKLKR